MTGPLCDELTGDQNGETTLVHLDQINLFIVPLDNERKWYRYHQLFAEFLQNRLRLTRRDSLLDLHHRASLWYEIHGFATEAIKHARAAGNFDRIADILERRAQDMVMRGEIGLLLDWLESLPVPIISLRPRLPIASRKMLL